jgi:hypothetical protein
MKACLLDQDGQACTSEWIAASDLSEPKVTAQREIHICRAWLNNGATPIRIGDADYTAST